MGERRKLPGHVGTPELREAVRTQIVVHGRRSSAAIAAELDAPEATVARVLQRFAAVGALVLKAPVSPEAAVEVAPGSLSARFRDLAIPLW